MGGATVQAVAGALADSTVSRAVDVLSDFSPLFALLLGLAFAGAVGYLVLGWVRG